MSAHDDAYRAAIFEFIDAGVQRFCIAIAVLSVVYFVAEFLR